jgi:hypothetical protein
LHSNDKKELDIAFIKNKCLPQLLILTLLQQYPLAINALAKLEEKA